MTSHFLANDCKQNWTKNVIWYIRIFPKLPNIQTKACLKKASYHVKSWLDDYTSWMETQTFCSYVAVDNTNWDFKKYIFFPSCYSSLFSFLLLILIVFIFLAQIYSRYKVSTMWLLFCSINWWSSRQSVEASACWFSCARVVRRLLEKCSCVKSPNVHFT